MFMILYSLSNLLLEELVYKVGSIVKIQSKEFLRSLPDYDRNSDSISVGTHFVDDMFVFCGKIFTITEVKKNVLTDCLGLYSKIYGDITTVYHLKEDGVSLDRISRGKVERFVFSSYMFAPIKTAKQLEFDF